jgi:hypothetical protein
MTTLDRIPPTSPVAGTVDGTGASMTAATVSLEVGRLTDAHDLLRQRFRTRQLTHGERFTLDLEIEGVHAAECLLPDDATVVATTTTPAAKTVEARTTDGSILVRTTTETLVLLSAKSPEQLTRLERRVQARVPGTEQPGTVAVRTWHLAGEFIRNQQRHLTAPQWSDIEGNYPARVRESLGELTTLVEPHSSARLILWHGAPGTGKTTALRALMRAWEPWCASQYIADPERFFAQPGSIAEVISGVAPTLGRARPRGANWKRNPWRLVVAEDCDDYLRSESRKDSGPSLGRLLNLADGVLGQGYDSLILLTTNEPISSLHPALTRPGRCLARIEFTAFTATEARAWLAPAEAPVDGPATLAELFELRGQISRIDRTAPQRVPGQYL